MDILNQFSDLNINSPFVESIFINLGISLTIILILWSIHHLLMMIVKKKIKKMRIFTFYEKSFDIL